MRLSLERRLKKRLHVEVALLQDEVVDVVYDVDDSLVLHGGTAVWRCYAGNRFSEDLDFYCADVSKIDSLLVQRLRGRGLKVLKYKKTDNLVFCKVSDERVEVRVEVNFLRKVDSIVASFEKTDGSFMDVWTLSAENLLLEKLSAFEQRRFVRDLYDVWHLSNYVKNDAAVKERVNAFLAKARRPVDEQNLKAIVFAGAVPSFNQLVESLSRRFA